MSCFYSECFLSKYTSEYVDVLGHSRQLLQLRKIYFFICSLSVQCSVIFNQSVQT